MSSISPSSDNGYRFYERRVAELEDQIDEEAKSARERNQTQQQKVEAAKQDEIQRRDEDIQKTVNHVKEKTQNALDREHAQSKVELDKLKAQIYDRNGRVKVEEAQLKDQIQKVEHDYTDMLKREQESRKQAEDVYEHHREQGRLQDAQKAEKSVQGVKNSYQTRYQARAARDEKNSDDDLKQAREQYNESAQRALRDREDIRHQYEHAMDDTQKDYEHRLTKTESDQSKDQYQKMEALKYKAEQEIEAQRNAHAEETKDLRNAIKDVTLWRSKTQQTDSESATDTLHRYENEWRTREKNQQMNHERELDKYKGKIAETEAYQSRAKHVALQEQAGKFTEALARTQDDTRAQLKYVQRENERERTGLQKLAEHTAGAQRDAHERQLQEASENTRLMLEKQAQAQQRSQRATNEANQATLEELKAKLLVKETSDDVTEMSPRAETALRKSLGGQYQRTLEEEKARSDRRVKRIEDEMKELGDTSREEAVAQNLKLTHQATSQSHQDLSRYRSYLEQAEFDKTQAIKNKELSHERQNEVQTKTNARVIEGQRRQYDEMFETLRFDNSNKIDATRQEADFKQRMAQKDFTLKYSEMVRGFERKLQEQRDQYEVAMENLKADQDKVVRDYEKKGKVGVEQQNRLNQQRAQQLEMQHKERERTLAENYENEIDKLRRANALLIQKKS